MWVLIDNYDSFTHILQHYLLQTANDCVVYRNDEVSVEELRQMNPERIIISPGPETPAQGGITMAVIDAFHTTVPIFGVCLGHQALALYFGAEMYQLDYPMHGKTSLINHNNHPLFEGIPSPYPVMRYHSLAVDRFEGTELSPIAHTDDGLIMALAHTRFPCIGVQFHPESVGTEYGLQLIKNWAQMSFE